MIRSLMSSTRQTVIRGPSLIGLGKRPVLMPCHQQDFLTGISGGEGGFELGSPMIWRRRRKPVSGSWVISSSPRKAVISHGWIVWICRTSFKETEGDFLGSSFRKGETQIGIGFLSSFFCFIGTNCLCYIIKSRLNIPVI